MIKLRQFVAEGPSAARRSDFFLGPMFVDIRLRELITTVMPVSAVGDAFARIQKNARE